MIALQFDPFPVLATARLLLRQMTLEDATAMQRLRSNDLTMQHIGRPKMKTKAEAEEFIGNVLNLQEKEEAIFWVITFKEEPTLMLGNICLWKIEKQHARAEVGYMLHPDHWQKGIMKETLSAIIKFGFNKMKLHSIEADISPDNTASIALVQSLGFAQEGHLKENYFHNGKFTDTLIFSLLNK